MNIHILGSNGWIGSAFVKYLEGLDHKVICVNRFNLDDWLKTKDRKDIVIYTIGITGDFKNRLFEACEAHVTLLQKVLFYQNLKIKNFLYFSSSRIYMRNKSTTEIDAINSIPTEINDFYNISKLMGESLILSIKNQNYKVVRISNVIGLGQPKETFIGQLIDECDKNGKAKIIQSSRSQKDYILLKDVINYSLKIINSGRFRLYNVSYGKNKTHKEISEWLRDQGYNIFFDNNSNEIFSCKEINNQRLVNEFEAPSDPLSLKFRNT